MDGRTGARWAPGGKGAIMQGVKGREGKGDLGPGRAAGGVQGGDTAGLGTAEHWESRAASSVFAVGRGEWGCGICKASSGVRRGLVGTGCYSRPTGCCNRIRACW